MHNTLNYKHDYSLVSNAFGFMRFPINFQPYKSKADWVITGVAFDATTSGRPGSRFGPSAIRQISTNLAWEQCRWPWNFNLRHYMNIIDCGDLVYNIGDIQDLSNKLEKHAERLILNGKHMLTFGGDHYITLPLLRAHAKKFGKMALIHFDAHADTYSNSTNEITFDHGTMFYTAPREGLIDPHHSIQIGIRTEFDKNLGFNVLDALEANNRSVDNILSELKCTVSNLPVYLTFDIDCIDPAYAPGTGTPVIGGLTNNKVINIIRGMQGMNIIGMDIVEVAPAYDHSNLTSLTAATLALDMLYVQAVKKIA
ncbi:agmatinase [Pantoea sp. Aalb]|uniref:agmatinase n=1 Tax=Pantoea sp. Aalb TaxID=2576762 RepID=UPI001325B6D6|nr:agmatinase [Pantoea sp. Aalb]MXP67727.1 agmatinase [Pantoea sp. Aalb]